MTNLRIILSIVIFTFTGVIIQAQIKPDSLQSRQDTAKAKVQLKIVSFAPENFEFGNKTAQDSLHYHLDSFQVVHPFLISTGNLGGPGHYLIPRYIQTEAFSVRPDAFGYFGFNRYNRRFYNTNQPYTLLQYFVGQPKEQFVNVLHTRNFGDNLNFSFHFVRIRSEGFYRRQNTSNTSLRTNLWYKSPGKRYAFMTDVFWTGVNVAENGGIERDSSFEFGTQLDRQQNEVRLDAAGTVQRKRDIWMKHTFALGKVTDTLVLDSAHSYNVITPAWGISIITELFDEKYNYQDEVPTSGFYDVIYYDSTITTDSTYSWRINNSIHLERFNKNGANLLRGYLGVRHEAGEYFNDTIYQRFQNVYAEGMIGYDDSTGTMVLNGWYVVSGFNAGDYGGRMVAHPMINNDEWNFTLDVYFDRLTAPMIYSNYSGNHLRWINTFSKQSRAGTIIGASYETNSFIRRVAAWGRSEMNRNVLYFDSTFLPQQFQGQVITNTVGVEFDFKAAWFGSQSKVLFSRTTNDTLVRLPELCVLHTMYANLQLFKKAMQLQVGVDITWFSEFTAEAYMPAVAQFYLQSDRKVGNYIYVSPWVSFRIKPVRVFVKVDHANAGLMGRKYFLLDHYPGNDLAVKIGISWLFND